MQRMMKISATAALLSAPLFAAHTASLRPDQVEAGIGPQITVSGSTSLCDPQFSHQAVAVNGNDIRFTVEAVENPAARCIAGDHPYSVDFTVPALKAGEYSATIFLQPACVYSPTPCPIAYNPDSAGTLYVTSPDSLQYSFTPKHTSSGAPFELFLTSKRFTCADSFFNTSTSMGGHELTVSFSDNVRANVLCPAIAKDYGPTFKIDALSAGVYQVFAQPVPYCPPGRICPLFVLVPQLAGALTVGDVTGLERPAVSGAAGARAQGALRVDGASVMGTWRGFGWDLTGRRPGGN